MPDHDLEPPRFARRALERLLNDWQAVKAMIMSGSFIRFVGLICFSLYSYLDLKNVRDLLCSKLYRSQI